mmetsp:Transcript_26569/g.80012  ORF Transcript_26569/g.80012 Transcript_26569/m.80012 type:complete len:267 (-) Transcript_26569:152-952(-)
MSSDDGAAQAAELAKAMAHCSVPVAVEIVQQAAQLMPGLRQALLDAWLIDDYEAEVGAFLADVRADFHDQGPSTAASETGHISGDAPGGGCAASACASASEHAQIPCAPESPLAEQSYDRRDLEEPTDSTIDDAAVRRRTILVAYFPRTAVEADLIAVLGKLGGVCRARIVRDPSGASQCYGFVEFEEEVFAESALQACRVGSIVLDDLFGHTWHLRASRACRATAASPVRALPPGGGRRRRGTRGGRTNRAAVHAVTRPENELAA